MFARVLLIALLASILGLGLGCEKVDHESIDTWAHTSKGPAKLRKALVDDSIDAELSAHAAATLIKRGDDPDVHAALETMASGRRTDLIARLAPRLWDIARIEDANSLPAGPQVVAKDALVRVRKWASDATRQQIDGYLIDWYCVRSYEGRAQLGANLGATVMRLVGPAASKKLIAVTNSVIAAPGQDRVRNKVGDELLLGLAATASPDAVKYVLDIVRMDRGDPTLSRRAMAALYRAYVDPNGLFDVADSEALVPHLGEITRIARDDAQDGQVANDAVALIRVLGAPRCLAPLVEMIGARHNNPRFKFVVANNALKCGGAKAIVEVVRALPDEGAYSLDHVTGAIAGEIAMMSPRDQALAAAQALLAESSTVAKWVGMEALAAMKATGDAPRIAALASSRQRLVGYWGERGEGKEDPTLGQRAKQLSAELGAK
jgi:hypothetical protein